MVSKTAARFFDREPNNWHQLEEMVQQAFAEMGYESNRAHKIQTVRGTVEIDVHAIKTSTPIPTIVLCECKYWDKPVPQHVVHTFRSVCSDAGAHFGLIISRRGFQSGAEISRTATNIHLMDFVEFQIL
jgi:restriction endonuclease Mrr